jgi:hypothetical protein
MRKQLAKDVGIRKKFRAVFDRLGKKTNFKGYSEETILLKDIHDTESNKMVTNHLWFSYTKGFQQLTLSPGMTIEFEARVKEYKKGYVNKSIGINQLKMDYKLSHPTRITISKIKN